MDIAKLLQELDAMVAWGDAESSKSHLLALCKQAAAAIRQLQAENTRSQLEAHAHFLLQLGEGISTLGKRIQTGA